LIHAIHVQLNPTVKVNELEMLRDRVTQDLWEVDIVIRSPRLHTPS
jgi:hypothetical protein